ncbi:hypothetical protein TNCT_42081 [Trichonephila clavata]|uniref:Uncharacterized protein n=1 Tax=Trichonephila clavata TaxID=2740835 RepID=A0A8X6HVK4_TRICU|nr:hypothetical protein TNCT_652431 [Trichonephila clavata]GFR30658.1 hypothetical protein TNCT_42081 [Trichonephila clavata]
MNPKHPFQLDLLDPKVGKEVRPMKVDILTNVPWSVESARDLTHKYVGRCLVVADRCVAFSLWAVKDAEGKST